MKRRTGWLVLAVLLAAGSGVWWVWGDRIEFVLGGAMINIGYRLQDKLEAFDFEHHADVTPQQVWSEFETQNRMASSVRELWPRSSHHPLVAMVACMDARLDTNEIAGDTRRYYYVLRLAGSVMSPKEEDMLELAIANGTKVVVFTTHSDCAAEKVSKDPQQAAKYPHLTQAIAERKVRFEEFLARPNVRAKIVKGELLVKWMHIDTATERVMPVSASSVN
ncbi:MAG: carbonic anhydrase [Bryobacteraceae bacterium]|nr:carbonic anhydrase [Bryobacteraceae bacterium]